jgi:hypothetical protein
MVKTRTKPEDDARFSKFNTDPKFRELPDSEKKHEVSDRFQKIFTDPQYQTATIGIDETGRRIEKPESDLKRLYEIKGVECVDEEGNFKWDVESSEEEGDEVEPDTGVDLYEHETNIPLGDETKKLAI